MGHVVGSVIGKRGNDSQPIKPWQSKRTDHHPHVSSHVCVSLSVSVCLCSVWKDKTMHNSVILIQRCDAPEWGGGARGEAGVPAGDTIHLT